MLSRGLLAAWIGVAALALLPAPVHAQGDWYIDDFHSDITINHDSGFDVLETIKVNFEAPHHGIYRQIPVRYQHDQRQDRVYQLEVRSVTDQGGRAWEYRTADVGPYVQVKIGNPKRTLTGVQTYRIAYHVLGAMNAFADHDELYWNVNGGDWAVPTNAASATVHAPAAVTQTACFEGISGSTESCVQSGGAGQSLNFAARQGFRPGEQLTIVVGLQKGAVATPPVFLEDKPRDPTRWFDVTPGSVALSLLLLGLGLGAIGYAWSRAGRMPHEALVVEFEPPGGLKPAQLGLIVDDTADSRDVTATIVDLAVHGYLTISELPPPRLPFAKADWQLTRTARTEDGLLPYEATILEGLFSAAGVVKVSSLKNSFYTTLRRAQVELYNDGVARRWYPRNPNSVEIAWYVGGLLVIIAGGAVAAGLGYLAGYGLAGVAIVLVGVAMLVAGNRMLKKTQQGVELFHKTLGFRLYLSTAERYRQQFAEKARIFTQLLPYAIVFGCVSRWAQAFAGLDTAASTAGWYAGTGPLQAVALSSTLQGFDTQVGGFITSSPSSSGFGGGGAGGGGGGGGGGAW